MSDQISVKVLCPYCGAEMRMISAWRMTMPEMGGFVWRARGKCPSCGSLTPETHGRTAQEANEAAYAAALRRYEPPITLDEALESAKEQIIDTFGKLPIRFSREWKEKDGLNMTLTFKIEGAYELCRICENYGWDMPECEECNKENGYKWFRREDHEEA